MHCISCFVMIIVYNRINVSTYLNFIESRKQSIRAKADDYQPSLVTEKNAAMLCATLSKLKQPQMIRRTIIIV